MNARQFERQAHAPPRQGSRGCGTDPPPKPPISRGSFRGPRRRGGWGRAESRRPGDNCGEPAADRFSDLGTVVGRAAALGLVVGLEVWSHNSGSWEPHSLRPPCLDRLALLGSRTSAHPRQRSIWTARLGGLNQGCNFPDLCSHDPRIDLAPGEAEPLKGPTEVGTGLYDDKTVGLSQLIDKMNERFGTDFKPADQLFFDQVTEAAVENETLKTAAKVNSLENFRHVFERMLEGLFIDRMEGNEEIFDRS
jgi:hypothetical protein